MGHGGVGGGETALVVLTAYRNESESIGRKECLAPPRDSVRNTRNVKHGGVLNICLSTTGSRRRGIPREGRETNHVREQGGEGCMAILNDAVR